MNPAQKAPHDIATAPRAGDRVKSRWSGIIRTVTSIEDRGRGPRVYYISSTPKHPFARREGAWLAEWTRWVRRNGNR